MWQKIKGALRGAGLFLAGAVAGVLAFLGLRKRRRAPGGTDALDAFKEKEDEIEACDASSLVAASPHSDGYGARIESRKEEFRRRADSAVQNVLGGDSPETP